MKSMICSTLLAVALAGGAAVWAEEGHDHKHDAPGHKHEEKAPTTKPVNTMCAVQPEHAADSRVTTVFEGKLIGFCCEDCIPEFKKDPQKYVAKMK